jgi:hypothetical protein
VAQGQRPWSHSWCETLFDTCAQGVGHSRARDRPRGATAEVGALDAEALDSLSAELRRCQIHFVQIVLARVISRRGLAGACHLRR